MSAKYYTHFIAQSEDAIEYNEYRGVVELLGQLEQLSKATEKSRACWHAASISRRPTSKCCSGTNCTSVSSPIP